MLKVIIVDDEQFIAQGLQALIDWNAAGYEVAAVLNYWKLFAGRIFPTPVS